MGTDELDPAETVELPIRGRCVCGEVEFEVTEPLLGAGYCYCKRCQRRTGSAFSATALAQPGSFRLTAGEDLVRTYDPGDGWKKSFCSECGGNLYTTDPDNPDLVGVRLGAIDGEPGVRPGLHKFTRFAAPWFPAPDDELPHFPEQLDWGQVPGSE